MDIFIGLFSGLAVIVLFWTFSLVMEWLDLQHARMRQQTRRERRAR